MLSYGMVVQQVLVTDCIILSLKGFSSYNDCINAMLSIWLKLNLFIHDFKVSPS